jgi:hypothetical protein
LATGLTRELAATRALLAEAAAMAKMPAARPEHADLP